MVKTLNHPNIIKFYSIERYTNFIVMTMKLCVEDLENFMTRRIKEGKPLTEEECA